MDKNGEAFEAFGQVFGFQEPGTVVLNPRFGNPHVRVATVESELDLYNAQGFPSKGLEHFFQNLSKYRQSGGEARIYVSICGLPVSQENPIQTSMDEMQILIQRLQQYADGFVWNPFSPNTAALKQLRTPEIFYDTAKFMSGLVPNKLKLVKIGPYEPEEKDEALQLVRKFIEGGGNGVVTTNTKVTPKEQLPESVRATWGYQSAGRSGAFLRSYRLRSVRDIRVEFPETIIFATGGIYTPEDNFETFRAGATCTEGFTPYAYYGPGLARLLIEGVEYGLRKNRMGTLEELQQSVIDLARRGKL
jgi:dihydroorotate dehydrogenase